MCLAKELNDLCAMESAYGHLTAEEGCEHIHYV